MQEYIIQIICGSYRKLKPYCFLTRCLTSLNIILTISYHIYIYTISLLSIRNIIACPITVYHKYYSYCIIVYHKYYSYCITVYREYYSYCITVYREYYSYRNTVYQKYYFFNVLPCIANIIFYRISYILFFTVLPYILNIFLPY